MRGVVAVARGPMPSTCSGVMLASGVTAPRALGHFRPLASLVVDLKRRVLAYRAGRLAARLGAVVGKPSTPTPTGAYFVEETVTLGSLEPGGPFALALSARSDALRSFDGGLGQIALHGRDSLGGTLGTAASHGCIRMSSAAIGWLAARVGPGVPVRIERSRCAAA